MANYHAHLDATTLTRARSICAFTLIEILIVVVIMGIAGALVVPQLSNAGQMTIQAAARMAIADVLYAQGEAVARQSVYKVVFDVDGNSYQLTDANDVVLNVPWLNGGYIVDFDADKRFAGITIDSVDFGGTTTVTFDELGAPDNGGTIEISANANRYRITVTAFTGRVTVKPIE